MNFLTDHDVLECVNFVTGKDHNIDEKCLRWIKSLLNDLNSSTLREIITLHVCGYERIDTKKGYDGFDSKTKKFKECKPKLFTTNKTDGSGTFTDLNPTRLEKYKQEDPDVIVSLFANNRLVFIFEIPFHVIHSKCEIAVQRECSERKQKHARSVTFNYNDYIDSKELSIRYLDYAFLCQVDCINKNFKLKLDDVLNGEKTNLLQFFVD